MYVPRDSDKPAGFINSISRETDMIFWVEDFSNKEDEMGWACSMPVVEVRGFGDTTRKKETPRKA